MYVCVCNAVTDRQIVKAVDAGCRTMKELRSELGVAACCGRCAGCARSVLNQAVEARNEPIFPAGAFALAGT
jgi:bacterioferritin-associated ferredoxin